MHPHPRGQCPPLGVHAQHWHPQVEDPYSLLVGRDYSISDRTGFPTPTRKGKNKQASTKIIIETRRKAHIIPRISRQSYAIHHILQPKEPIGARPKRKHTRSTAAVELIHQLVKQGLYRVENMLLMLLRSALRSRLRHTRCPATASASTKGTRKKWRKKKPNAPWNAGGVGVCNRAKGYELLWVIRVVFHDFNE